MTQSDLYIRGNQSLLKSVRQLVVKLAENVGCSTAEESALNIPLGLLMQLLVGDAMYLGLVIGILTDDPECLVMRVECCNVEDVCNALLECFPGVEIEVNEDVEDVPWPFE